MPEPDLHRLLTALKSQAGSRRLAQELGVSEKTISRWLKEDAQRLQIRAEHLDRIARLAANRGVSVEKVAELAPPKVAGRSLRRDLRIDAYQLDQRLGRGHSAEVWKARVVNEIPGVELRRGATVAMKFYLPSLLQGFQPLRIQREFTVASDVLHENLARVYDLVLSPSRPFHTFMVMEYVNGPKLKSFIERRGPLKLAETLSIGAQVFSALVELHSVGAIHRDVKAANIMVASDDSSVKIKLVDLGIVALAAEDKFTQASLFLGSKHSAPLEQLTGEELDERTDIYGAGSVLYHCIRGVPMYNGVGPEGAIVRKMLSVPERLTLDYDGASPVERDVFTFVNRCIAVDPKARPESADACRKEILRFLASNSPRPG